MKKINLFSKLWSSGGNSQSSDVGYDCRLTVGSPSGFGSKSLLKFVSVLALIFTLGVGNAWGAITNNNNGTYTEPSGTGSAGTGTITWSFAGGNITVVQSATGGNAPGNYLEAARIYRYNTLSCTASNGFKIEKVEIVCSSTKYGANIGAGSSMSGNSVTGTSDVTSDVAYTSGHTHSFTPTTAGAKTQMYIRNANTGTTNVQIQWASGGLKVTYSYTAPTAVAKGTVTSSSFGLSITDALNTNKYDVYFSTSSTAPTATTSATVANQTTKTPTISSGVSAGQNYYVWVRSVKTVSSDTWKSLWTAMTSNPLSTPSAGCANYSFHYGATAAGDGKNITDQTVECFTQVSTSTEWQVTDFTIPTTTQYYFVGYKSYFYDSNIGPSGASNAGSERNQFKYLPVANLQGSSCGGTGDSYKHAAAGAYGTLRIYSNYSDKNLYVGFVPAGYQMRIGSGASWSNVQLTQSSTVWTSAVMDIDATLAAKNYYINVWTGASYSSGDAGVAINNWTDGGSTISSMKRKTNSGDNWADGVSNGMRGFFRTWVDNCANNGYCHFVPTHRVVFHSNYPGGGGPADTYSVDVSVEETNSSLALASAPSAPSGYTFDGWYDAADGGNKITTARTISAGATANIELYAHWTPDVYTVTATLTNVSANTAFPSSFTYTGSSTTALNRTLNAATGYNRPTSITVTMGGSTLTKDTHYTYNNSTGAFAFTATITGNIVITVSGVAKTYSNTLEREGGTTGSTSVTTTYNSSTLTSYTAPTKTGYTFGGYWSADNGTGTEVIGTNGALKTSVTIDAVAWTDANGKWVKDGAVTLYAKWTANTYTVAFDKNHASATGTMSNQTGFTYGVGKALSTCTFGAPTHKYFYGWHRTKAQADAGNREYTDGQSVTDVTATNGATVTLYAVWKDHTFTNYRTLCADQFDIVLDDGLPAATNNGSAKVANNGTTITNIVAPTKNGYDVDYYCTNSGLGTQIATAAGVLSASVSTWTDGTGKWILGAGATFYTKWTAHEYTITYNLNGGSGATNTTYTIESSAITLPTAATMSRNGYDFTAWYANSDLSTGGVQTTIPAGSTGDKEYWAKWTAKQFTVTLNANGGVDGATTSVTATFNEAMPTIAAANLPTRDGYRFDGFYTGKTDGTKYYNADGTSAKAYAKYSSDPSAHVLYAHWKAQTKFSVDGVVDPSLTIDDNAAMPSATVPVACGDCWGFLGWSEDPDESSAIDYAAGATHTFGEPTTLYAVFGKVEYKWVTNLSDLVNNEYYILTMLDDEDNERALANSVTNTKYATATDISSNLKENSSGFYIYNPDPSIVWKFTGTTSSGRLYNESASKYLDLSSTSNAVLQASTSDNLNFTKFNSTLFNIASTSQTSQFLYMYTNPFWGVDDDHDGYASCYIYKRQPSTVTTSPSCDTYTIAWKVGSGNATGSPTTSTNTCTGIEDLPNTPADNSLACATKFMGWSESTLVGPGKAEPVDLFTTVGGAPKIDDNKEFHAVFATASIGESTSTLSQTYNTVTLGTNYNDDGSDDFTLTDSEGNSISMERENMIEGSYSSYHYIQIRNASGAGFWNATPIPGAITNITVNAYSANSFKLYVGTSKKGTTEEKTIASTTQQSFNFDAEDGLNYFYFASNSAAGQITSYTITYKAIEYSDYMTSCCNELITLSDPSIDGSGCAITFDKSSPVATCEGGVDVEATVTVTPGFRVTALSFSGGDVVIDPSISTPLTSSQTYTLSFAQHTTATLTTTATVEALRDEYYDYMHDNVKKYNKDGNYNTVPTLSSKPAADDSGCKDDHYKFKGWVVEDEINENGTLKDGYTLILGGTTGKYATGKKYYAVWAEEE